MFSKSSNLFSDSDETDNIINNEKIDAKNNSDSTKNFDWVYYTRSPLMDTYRDNLYRDNYSISALISMRGSNNDMSLGLSIKVTHNETGNVLRIVELENFLFSVIVDTAQIIENEEYKIRLEDFSKYDSKLIRFLNITYQEGNQNQESGKLWFKDYNLGELLDIIKNINLIKLETRVITFSDDILKVIIKGENDTEGNVSLNIIFKDIELEAEKIYTFGINCPYILYKDTFYFTTPSYPKVKKTLFKENIKISKEYISDFCARVLPNLKKDFELEMPPNIKESEERVFPAQALVFLDYDGDYVYGAIKFKYGKFTIDPYSGKCTSSDMLNLDIEIYRDKEKEDFFCETLSKYLNRINEYTFSTNDDEKIFVLCYKALPLLQERGWACFYSEDFRALKINVKPPRMIVKLSKDINFFEINFSFEGVEEIHDLSNLVSEVKKENKEYIRLQNGSFIPVDLEIIDYLAKILNDNSLKDSEEGNYLIPMFNAPYFADILEKHGGITLELEDDAKTAINDIKKIDYDEEPPENLTTQLRPYQLTGYKWIRKLADMSLNGILADDMGLGKSFQTIASILKDKQNGSGGTSLIVAPTSCVTNWYMEIKKFAPSLHTIILNGVSKARLKRIKSISNYDIAIISYGALRRDAKVLSEYTFNYVILDEAQHIKNANTQNAKTVKSLTSIKRLALSGTPIENSISELWSMFDFLMPGFLGKHQEFIEHYESPIISNKDGLKEVALNELKTKIAPFILRRLKKDVLKDLPAKHTNIAYCDLTKDQKELYMSILEAARIEIFETVKRKGFNQSQIEIFSALTRLRQVCCHPRLLAPDLRGESHTSGKFNMFIEMIRESINGGHNVLVFSQFTKMLHIMRDTLTKLNIDFLYLDGKTRNRMDLVNRFNAGEAPIFLLSLKAAGTGLTLTKADTVMHYDLWWNPAVEDQATDRAYRIGQKRVVTNYKLVTRGTIEEKILALQDRKREIIDAVIDDASFNVNKMSWDEIKNLITL